MKRLLTFAVVAAMTMTSVGCSRADEKKDAPALKEASESTPSEAEPTASDRIDAMVAACEASAEARTARQAEKPLYERLGGHDAIMAVTKRIIEFHVAEDSPIKGLFENTDLDQLAEYVVDFIGAGTGGPEEYTGRSMKESHASLNMTPEMFLAAGEDIMQALAEFEVPQNETEEFMCIILSFKDDVLAK